VEITPLFFKRVPCDSWLTQTSSCYR
jgi:hypothetical protein